MVRSHYSAVAGIIPVKIIETYLFFRGCPHVKTRMEGLFMLKSELFDIKTDATNLDACKKDNFLVMDAVKTVVRHAELAKAEKAFKDLREKFESVSAGVDALTAEVGVVVEKLGVDAGDFITKRDAVVELRKEVEACMSLDTVTALPLTDRVHINLLAHQIYKSIDITAFNSDFLSDERAKKIAEAIKTFYTKGSGLKQFKEYLRPLIVEIFNNEDCKYFYPVTCKRSFIDEWLLHHFVASFGGNASRKIKTGKDDLGNKTVNYEPYNYSLNLTKAQQVASITDLCSVVLANEKYHEVIKPEVKSEDKKAK